MRHCTRRSLSRFLPVAAAAIVVHALALRVDAQTANASRTWTIEATPLLRLGKAGSAQEFAVAVSAARFADGSIIVGDRGGDFALYRFDASGKLMGRAAAKGKGPTEISMLLGLYRCGDSLVTVDFDDRYSVFSARSEHIRTFRLDRTRKPYRSACGASGRMVHFGWDRNEDMKKDIFRSQVPLWIAGLDERSGVTLAMVPGSERYDAGPLPLGREPRLAIGRDRAYFASADSVFVHVYSLDGRSLPPLRAATARVRATPADRAAAIERDVEIMGESSRKFVVQSHSAAPKVEFLPATRDLIVDGDDNLWVQHFPRGGVSTVMWTVFARSGAVLATVQLPAVLEVFEIGRDYVLGRYTDVGEAVPEVRIYKLKR